MSTSMAGKPISTRWKIALTAGIALATASVAGGANAQYEAYVTSSAPLLAGPSPDYPAVAGLEPGTPVEVYGCVSGWEWCDVSFQGVRGWFDGQLLAYPYEGERVPIFDYGPRIGLPVITFNFDDYWGRYYHDRPFFGERERWARVPPRELRSHEGRPGPGAAFHPEGEHGPGPRPEGERGPGRDAQHPEMVRPGAPAPQGEHRGPPPQAQQPAHAQRPGPAPAPQAQHPAPAPHPQGEKPAPRPEGHHEEHQ